MDGKVVLGKVLSVFGPKVLLILAGSTILVLGVFISSLRSALKEHDGPRWQIIGPVALVFLAGIGWHFYGDPNLAPALLEKYGKENIKNAGYVLLGVGALIARFDLVAARIGESEFLERVTSSVHLRRVVAIVPILTGIFFSYNVAEWDESILNRGDFQLSKQSAESQTLVRKSYANLERAFRQKDYAATIQEADRILAVLPGGYHFAVPYRLDAQKKLAEQTNVGINDSNRMPSQVPMAPQTTGANALQTTGTPMNPNTSGNVMPPNVAEPGASR